MSAPEARTVEVNGHACRVWERGEGPPLGYLGGPPGVSRWTPFLDALATRRRVVVPSIPGYPGATGHEALDDLSDWVVATLDLLDAAGLEGADLVGVSVGATLAAEAAAFCPHVARALVLVAPLGASDPSRPIANVFAAHSAELHELLCADGEHVKLQLDAPEGLDEVEWAVQRNRAMAAGARLLWPLCDTGLAKRLHRITVPTLLLWGREDRVVPPSYAARVAAGIAGPVETVSIDGAGHLADWDRPQAVADAVLAFLDRSA